MKSSKILELRFLKLWLVSALLGATVMHAAEGAIQLVPVLQGLSSPVYVTSAHDGTQRLFVIEQPGRIKVLASGASAPSLFLDIASRVLSGGEQGLLGLAFHPQFASNSRFFVNYTRQNDGATVIAEYHASTDPIVTAASENILLVIAQPFANHNGGMIEFGGDGYLYIGMGDGGSANDPQSRAQNINELLGKILRIDVDHPAGGNAYSSPPGNPFVGATPGRDEIYAVGMRNPFRFSFDRGTGQLYVGDVGQGALEEVDIVTAGGNYGWRVYEGTQCTNLDPTLCTPTNFVAPIAQYGHTGGRCSITGGYVYRGSAGALPAGTYVFGDYCTGEIFSLAGSVPNLLLDTSLNISSFGEDEAGEIYVVGLGGTVHRISPTGPTATTTTLATSGSPSVVGANVIFTATVTGSAPTGSVGFTADGATLSGCAAVALSGSGNARTAMCSTSGLSVGTHSIVASYGGDAANSGSTSSTLSQVVNSSGSPPAALVNPSFEAPVLSGGGYQYGPSGAGVGWTFVSSGVQSNGSAWGAAAAPDGTQTAFIQSLSTMSQSISLTAGSYTLSFQAARRGGQIQPVRVSVDGAQIGSLVSPASSSFSGFSIAFSVASTGAHTITFAGTDPNDRTTFIDNVTLSSGSTSSTTTLTTSGSPSVVSANVTFTATVNGSAPTGSVTFTADGTTICSAAPFSGGTADAPTATCSTSNLTQGTHSIVASYGGDAANSGSTSATLSQVVNASGSPPVALVNPSFEAPVLGGGGYQYNPGGAGVGWTFVSSGVQSNGSAWGAAVAPDGTQTAFIQSLSTMSQSISLTAGSYTLSFQAAQRSGQIQPVQVSVDGAQIGSLVSPASTSFSSFSMAFSVATTGVHTLTFAGTDPNDRTTFIDNVTLSGGSTSSTTTTLATSGSPSVVGANVIFTATVTGSAPTGSVGFTADGATLSGCAAVALSGSGNARTAMCSTSGLSVGTHSIVASYGGDAANSGSTSSTLSQVVNSSGSPPAALVNPSFEAPVLSGGGYQYGPSGAGVGWTFVSSGVQSNGSAWGAAAAPDGTQTAFIQSLSTMSQSISLTAGSYTLSFQAAQRSGQIQPVQVSVDSAQIGSLVSPASTSFSSFSMAFSVATTGVHTLTFAGTDPNDRTTFIDAVTLVSSAPPPATLVNPSFEVPAVGGGYQYGPSGADVGWTFFRSGVQGNGSAWGAAAAPDGTQTAFIQGVSTMSQSINLTASSYTLSFQAARRSGQIQPVRVSVDGAQIGSLVSPASTSFSSFSIPFTVSTTGAHTLTFAGTDPNDLTTFIDKITLQ